jgi:hypothetical protein
VQQEAEIRGYRWKTAQRYAACMEMRHNEERCWHSVRGNVSDIAASGLFTDVPLGW